MTLPANGNAPLNTPSHFDEHVRLANIALRPSAIVTRTTTQNLGTSSWGACSWTTEVRDTFNLWDVSNPTRFTCPAGYGGLWLVQQTQQFQSNATGLRGLQFVINGGGQSYGVMLIGPITGTHTMSTSAIVPLSPGDYVEAQAHQQSGVTLTIGGVNAMYSIVNLVVD